MSAYRIEAGDPGTIRALLEERDALRDALIMIRDAWTLRDSPPADVAVKCLQDWARFALATGNAQ